MTEGANSIAQAIRDSLDHIRKHKDLAVWDSARELTDDQVAERSREIESICGDLEHLAEKAANSDVRFTDYEPFRAKLASLRAHPLDEDLRKIAEAFRAAGRLERDQTPGW